MSSSASSSTTTTLLHKAITSLPHRLSRRTTTTTTTTTSSSSSAFRTTATRISSPIAIPSTTTKQSFFSTTTAAKMGSLIPLQKINDQTHPVPSGPSAPFLEAMLNRRSIYALTKSSPIPDAKIEAIVNFTLKHAPSSFNCQNTRIAILGGKDHDKFWGEIVMEALRAIVPTDAFAATEAKIKGFMGAYATILFFDSQATVRGMQEKYPIYADKFGIWAAESNAMHQYAIWTALEAEGLGANLQHYNPLVDEKVSAEWDFPREWELRSQLVVGAPKEGAAVPPKGFQDVEGERLRTFGLEKK